MNYKVSTENLYVVYGGLGYIPYNVPNIKYVLGITFYNGHLIDDRIYNYQYCIDIRVIKSKLIGRMLGL